jgi:PAS domain S-box-containing protein
MDYNYEPALEIWGQLFIKPDGQIKELADLEGQSVAIMSKDINGRNFQKVAGQLGINCNYLAFPNFADVLAATQAGTVVAGVTPQHFGLRHAKTYGLVPSSIQFSPFPIYYATKKGRHRLLLSQIDSYLSRWQHDQDSFYYQQLNYWLTGKQLRREIIPRWLLLSLTAAASTALILLGLSLLFNAQIRRKTAELVAAYKSISHSEKRYRTLVESMIQPMALHEIINDDSGNPVDFRFLDVNPAFEQLLGKSAADIIGKRALEISPDSDPELIKRFGQVASSGNSDHFEINDIMTGKHLDIVAYSAAPGRFVVIATDFTERVKMREEQRQLQDQLLHAQKLESLGVLAGGIAHDFNNILMAVLGHCELALRRLVNESPARQNIVQIKASANKAADLANQMLAYSGKGKFVIEPIDLSKVVEEMQQMLSVSISKKAILRYEFVPGLPSVEADATQLRQVILNLVINASDAIGDRSGVIAITTGVLDCDEAYLQDSWLDEQLRAGQYVYLEVADTGCGMDRDTINRIFEPFFSTKFTGRGLGMAAVLGIVRGHKGAIKVYSEQNRGTTFKILLPAASKPAILYDIDQDITPLEGDGIVLLVDDDETVRSIGREMLEEFGFTVITAVDGKDALEKFKEASGMIRFVLMDLTMPHMDGKQAFRELRSLDPQVKVIMSSGYNEQEISQQFAGKGICGFLKKPYQLSELQKAIQKLSD